MQEVYQHEFGIIQNQHLQVVNVLNKGAIDFLDDTDAVEVCARIGKNGAEPLKVTGVVTDHMKEYLRNVKAYEKHAVKAALTGDKLEAMRALVINPLCGDLKTASACFDEMVEAHIEFLPQFKKEQN